MKIATIAGLLLTGVVAPTGLLAQQTESGAGADVGLKLGAYVPTRPLPDIVSDLGRGSASAEFLPGLLLGVIWRPSALPDFVELSGDVAFGAGPQLRMEECNLCINPNLAGARRTAVIMNLGAGVRVRPLANPLLLEAFGRVGGIVHVAGSIFATASPAIISPVYLGIDEYSAFQLDPSATLGVRGSPRSVAWAVELTGGFSSYRDTRQVDVALAFVWNLGPKR